MAVLLLENKGEEGPPHKELGLSNLYAGGPSILYVVFRYVLFSPPRLGPPESRLGSVSVSAARCEVLPWLLGRWGGLRHPLRARGVPSAMHTLLLLLISLETPLQTSSPFLALLLGERHREWKTQGKTLKRGIGVGVKLVTGSDAIVAQ